MKFDNSLLCGHEEAKPDGFVNYLVRTLAQNFISYLRVDRRYMGEPDKRLANSGASRSVELLSEKFVKGGRKIARRNIRVLGMRSQPKHGWPTMSQSR